MTPEAFNYWLWSMHPDADLRLTDRDAGSALGCHRVTVAKYRKEGAPKFVALACSALARGLGPWDLQPTNQTKTEG